MGILNAPLGVSVLEALELVLQEDILLSEVAKDERDLGLVLGVYGPLVWLLTPHGENNALLKMALATCHMGAIPVPPAIMATCSTLLAVHGNLGMGPLMSSRWPGSMLCICSDMGPLGYFLTMNSTVPFWSTSLTGV